MKEDKLFTFWSIQFEFQEHDHLLYESVFLVTAVFPAPLSISLAESKKQTLQIIIRQVLR